MSWREGATRHPNVLAVALALAFLGASQFWSLASGAIALPGSIAGDDAFSTRLIVGSLLRNEQDGDSDIGGFMLAFEPEVHIAAVKAIDGPGVVRDNYPFISHYGLQYNLLKVLPPSQLWWAQLVLSLAMAVVVGIFCRFAAGNFSALSAVAVALVFCLSPLLIGRAQNLYWFMFLSFLPFAVSALLYPRSDSPRRFALLSVVVSLLVCLKALTGYEYLTNVTLGAMLPVLFFELSRHGATWATFVKVFRRTFLLGAASVGGFAVAAALHVAKAAAFFGDWSKGLQALILPFRYSLVESGTGIRQGTEAGLGALAGTFVSTFLRFNWPVVGAVGLVVVLGLTGLAWAGARRNLGGWQSRDVALALTTLAAGLASVSWFVAAPVHSIVHPHINWIAQYLFFLPFAAICGATMLERTVRARQA